MSNERLKGEFCSPREESDLIKFELALLEEAGVHELLPELQESVARVAPRSQTKIGLEARVLNSSVAHGNNFRLYSEEEEGLIPAAVPGGISFSSITDDNEATAGVRTQQGPFVRLNFIYDIGQVSEFERKRRRDEVLTVATSYQAISIEASRDRRMRVYHHSFLKTQEAVGGKKVARDIYTVDKGNAFVFPYYTETHLAGRFELGTVRLHGGWSSQDSGDIGILDKASLDTHLKVPVAALFLLKQHPPRHLGR